MFLFYIDESGGSDPLKAGDDPAFTGIYCLTAVGVFAQKWHTFEKRINRRKLELIDEIEQAKGYRLELADCEIKSAWIRIKRQRESRPFIRDLSDEQVRHLVDLYYEQIRICNMTTLSVVVDKQRVGAMTQNEILSVAWDRLMKLIEEFMRARNRKHQALIINDDISPQVNRKLAMLHANMMLNGTEGNTWLRHICEMPMFVKSELSIGVQIADLCSYNILRAMRDQDFEYEHFQRMAPSIWTMNQQCRRPFSGIWVEGQGSPLIDVVRQLEKQAPSFDGA